MKIYYFLLISIFIALTFSLFISRVTIFRNFTSHQSVTADPKINALEILKICDDLKTKNTCLSYAFLSLVQRESLVYALNVLAKIEENETSQEGCHFIAHIISVEEIRKNPKDWENVLKTIPIEECTGGFLMGVIEGRSLFDKNFVLNSKSVRETCSYVKDSTHQASSEMICIHTMGHLLLVENAGDINKTLSVCDSLDEIYQLECASGTFMESEYRRNLALHNVGKVVPWNIKTINRQKNLCDTYTGTVQNACFRELSHMYLFFLF